MPLSQFLTGNRKTMRRPDEILAAIQIPRKMDEAVSTFLKLGARRYLVISISMVAAVVLPDADGRVAEARIAVGSCSATAQRLTRLEADLKGQPFKAGLGSAVKPDHLSILSPIDDIRATANYRRDASVTLIRRALENCVRSV
jgi:CO/xanthine dehydrogenase FAD-binding subunit